MSKLVFPAVLESNDAGGFIVSFPDLPEALTEGPNRAQALENARDALAVALLGRLKDGTDLPTPGPARGRPMVSVLAMCAAKIAVIERWRETGISESELAARLGREVVEVRHILDPRRRTRINLIEDALAAMGRHVVIETHPAPEAEPIGRTEKHHQMMEFPRR